MVKGTGKKMSDAISSEANSILVGLGKELIDVLRDLRREVFLLRGQGLTSPLPTGTCCRCETKSTPVEKFENVEICQGCLVLTLSEFGSYLRFRKEVLIPRALESGETRIGVGVPAQWQQVADESAEREASVSAEGSR